MAHDVFISHSAADKPTADAVCAKLESRGVRCWIAPRDVLPGVSWPKAIIEALNESRVMVLVFSGHANQSPQIEREVAHAVHKGVAVLPVRIENVLPAGSLEYYLSTPHWLDALTPPLDRHLEQLVETISLLLSRIPRPEATTRAPVGPDAPAPALSSPPPMTAVQGPAVSQPPVPPAPPAPLPTSSQPAYDLSLPSATPFTYAADASTSSAPPPPLRQADTGRASSQAVAALVLGIASIFTCIGMLGIVAVLLGSREMKEIAGGRSAAAGQAYARAGVVTGWIGLGFGIVSFIYVVANGIGGSQ